MLRLPASNALPGFRVGLPDDIPGFRVGQGGLLPEGYSGMPGAPSDPPGFAVPQGHPETSLWHSAGLLTPYPTDFPAPDVHDGNVHPAKDPLRCSGPNSTCEAPGKKRAFGTFRDHEIPPLRLCQDCYRRKYGTPSGDDT